MKIGLFSGLFPFKHIVKVRQIKQNKTKRATAIHFPAQWEKWRKFREALLLVLGFVSVFMKTAVKMLPKRNHTGNPNLSHSAKDYTELTSGHFSMCRKDRPPNAFLTGHRTYHKLSHALDKCLS